MQAMKLQVTSNKTSESFFDLKMATRFLVSISVFSIIVSHFSLLPFLLNIVKLFSSSANKTIDKNYMFLLCNGILVFIFKNSVWFKNNSPQEPVAEVSSKIVSKKRYNRRMSPVVEKKVVQEPELALVAVVAEEKQVQEKNEFEDEDEEENGSLSREELNKKCDDFIRKMKEVIKFEA